MSDVERTELAVIAAPYRREVRLEEALFDSGMKMFRVVIREGHRITQIDLDREAALKWVDVMSAWAKAQPEGKVD